MIKKSMGNESTKKEKLSRTGSPVNTCKSTSLGLQIIHLKGVNALCIRQDQQKRFGAGE